MARVKLLVPKRSSLHVRESSKELIADLESQLGNMTTEYLTVGISYKHSAFSTSEDSTSAPNGLSYHATTIKIEAYAAIKRHCSQSSWCSQALGNPDMTGLTNPVVSSINSHCDPTMAAELIRKITIDHVPLAGLHRQELDLPRRWDSSSDTIIPMRRNPSMNALHKSAQQENSVSPPTPKQSLDITQAGFHDPDSNVGTLGLNPCSDLDPARKIWSEMRRNSRGTIKRRPLAKSCPESFDSSSEEMNGGSNDAEVNMIKEQARIMEMALRNKRSVGADTLRSMAAPSMGLSMGRGWGWGPPWW